MSSRAERRRAARANGHPKSPARGGIMFAYPHSEDVNAHFEACKSMLIRHDSLGARRILAGGDEMSHFTSPRLASARNTMVNAFLAHPRAPEWYMPVDTDMVFPPDSADRLLDIADPVERPFVGGLCFAGGRSGKVVPTLYRLTQASPPQLEVMWDYERNALNEVDATGAAFCLIHRSVFERLRERYGTTAYPYYAESGEGLAEYGEDITLCLRARAEGIRIFVDTSLKIGHMKSQVIDEFSYLQYRRGITAVGEDAWAEWHRARLHLVDSALPESMLKTAPMVLPEPPNSMDGTSKGSTNDALAEAGLT